ncbi:MAG TPA: YncE family protein [Steroidobacteraceae bacterium]|nr:YncE family protein [Steroidobacteraceae bacterium]
MSIRRDFRTARRCALLMAVAALLTSYGPMRAAEQAAPAPVGAAAAYHVTRKVALGAPDRWDYVVFDPDSRRVYVAHGDRVTVVDGDSGARVGEVTGFAGGTHGIAIATAAGRGYTDDGRAGRAGSFDLRSLHVEHLIATEPGSDAIAFDPSSGHVFVINGEPSTVSVIDPRSDRVVATIHVGGDLEYAGAAGGKLYVNGAERRELVRIDTASNVIDARWPLAGCVSPHGLALDAHSRRVFVSCVNEVLLAVDADSGAIIARLPIGRGTDAAAFDPQRKLVFSSNGRDGTISVIEERTPSRFLFLGNIQAAVTGRTMALDPRTGRIYLAAAQIATPSTSAASTAATAGATPAGRARRPPLVPGSLELWFIDPAP